MENLLCAIESILFVADRPTSIARLKEVLGETVSEDEILNTLEEIYHRYEFPNYGFTVRKSAGGYQFVSRSEYKDYVHRFLATRPLKLSRSALEVLAIIAYRQPITRAEIDHVRGIDSSHVLKVLMDTGLVKMAGKADVPGKPVQYATTEKFLETVGLNSLDGLPPLSELEKIEGEKKEIDFEPALDKFISETRDSGIDESWNENLTEINQLIESANLPDDEVYISPLHKELIMENRNALEECQRRFSEVKRRKELFQEDQSNDNFLITLRQQFVIADNNLNNKLPEDSLPESSLKDGV